MRLTRRDFLRLSGLAAVAYWVGSLTSRIASRFPSVGAVETVSGDVSWESGKMIPAGTRLRFDSTRSTTVTVSGGNVVVEGILEMNPASPGVVHTLRFVDVNESAFVGGGMDPVASDVGLWIMGDGVLHARGSPKLPWAKAAGSLPAEATSLTLDADPIGWQVGDELAICPTARPSASDHYAQYDLVRIIAISGRVVTFTPATAFAHPAVLIPASASTTGRTMTSEVLNLSRNCRIEGTSGGRSHVFIRSARPQAVSHVSFRHLGPPGKLGRYPLHFHQCGESSRGSVITGVLVRDSGQQGFVPHTSHGITFQHCVAHNAAGPGYWWDTTIEGTGDDSNDILYDRCVASACGADDYRSAGFVATAGFNNRMAGCVAVGNRGKGTSGGFLWPEGVPDDERAVWGFADNVSHNNQDSGAFVWSNDNKLVHHIERVISYHNGGSGWSHGAYVNMYEFTDGLFYGNREDQFNQHLSQMTKLIRCLMDSAGFSGYPLDFAEGGSLAGSFPHEVTNCAFRGYSDAAIHQGSGGKYPTKAMIKDCTFSGKEFWWEGEAHPEAVWQVFGVLPSSEGDGSIAIGRYDRADGMFVPAWNAKWYEIEH